MAAGEGFRTRGQVVIAERSGAQPERAGCPQFRLAAEFVEGGGAFHQITAIQIQTVQRPRADLGDHVRNARETADLGNLAFAAEATRGVGRADQLALGE